MGYAFVDFICLGKHYKSPDAVVFNLEDRDPYTSLLLPEELIKGEVTFSRAIELIKTAISRPYFPEDYYTDGQKMIERIQARKCHEKWFFIELLVGPTPYPTKYLPIVEDTKV